jgi:hypothetical protein
MQTVGQHMDRGIRPIDEFAIVPDLARHPIERDACHISVLNPSSRLARAGNFTKL